MPGCYVNQVGTYIGNGYSPSMEEVNVVKKRMRGNDSKEPKEYAREKFDVHMTRKYSLYN